MKTAELGQKRNPIGARAVTTFAETPLQANTILYMWQLYLLVSGASPANQTFASTPTPLGGSVRGLVRKLFQVDGFQRVGNLRPNRLPELKLLLCWYPSELQTTVSHRELHGASVQKLGKIALVKVPDPFIG